MSSLRRFVKPPPAVSDPAVPDTALVDMRPASEKCELCATAVPAEHGHVVDTENRALLCACRPCYLLFTSPGAARFRAVPDRYLEDRDRPLTRADWDRLGIPVGSAFFLRGDSGVAAFYPSPAGATECLLDLDVWAELAVRHPLLAAAEPEVEAILVQCTGRGAGEEVQCYLVPIDACYELVGTVRMHWKGFDGGDAPARIEQYFDGVRSRARKARA